MRRALITMLISVVATGGATTRAAAQEENCVIAILRDNRGVPYEQEVCSPVPQPRRDTDSDDEPRPVRGGGSGRTTICTYTPGPDYTPGAGPEDVGSFRMQDGRVQMVWVRQCPGLPDLWFWRDINGTPEAPEVPPPTPQDLIPGAFASVERQLPTPVPVIAPADRTPNGFAYVRISTFFWVEQTAGQWAPVSATASLPGLSVTVTAEPQGLTVDPGDGTAVDCPGAPPALPIGADPTGFDGCEHVYLDSSSVSPNGETFPVTATIVWHATWQASNSERGDLGRLTTTSATRDLPVAEIQSVVTQG